MSRHPGNDAGEGFIGRWSRRKSEVDRPEEAPSTRVEDDNVEEPVALNRVTVGHTPGRMQTMVEADRLKDKTPGAGGQDKPVLTDEDMPPLESLNEDSDFSGFLSPGVSEKLRRAAMRKLFSAAVFNVRDGLDDYDEDFTNFEPLGDIVTSDMKHQAEVAERRRREAEEAEAAEAGQEESEEASQVAQDPEAGQAAEPEAVANEATGGGEDDAETVARADDQATVSGEGDTSNT